MAAVHPITTGLLGLTCLASCVTSKPEPRRLWTNPQTTVRTYDAAGRPVDSTVSAAEGAGRSIWGKPPSPEDVAAIESALQDPQPEQEQDPDAARRQREAMIRATFGDAVSIAPDGTLTKIYPVTTSTGSVFLGLTKSWDEKADKRDLTKSKNAQYGGERRTTVLDRLLGEEHVVDVVYLADFSQVDNFTVPKKPDDIAKIDGGSKNAGALVIVTAKPSSLGKFESALDLFYVNIPQIEIEVKVVEYTTTDSTNFGVQNSGTDEVPIATLNNLSSSRLVENITSNFPLSAPFLGATSVADSGLIRLGGIHDSWELDTVLQALQTESIADIISQPRLVVRNGGTATVQTSESLPFPQARISTTGNTIESNVQFKEVGIVMTIKPEIAGTDTVTLLVHASVAAANGFAGTVPIPTPIISKRAATTSVHLREGETMVIGGLVTQSKIESESKIPILGDIPILGYLFRSTSSQEQRTTLEFHITPTILRSSGG